MSQSITARDGHLCFPHLPENKTLVKGVKILASCQISINTVLQAIMSPQIRGNSFNRVFPFGPITESW